MQKILISIVIILAALVILVMSVVFPGFVILFEPGKVIEVQSTSATVFNSLEEAHLFGSKRREDTDFDSSSSIAAATVAASDALLTPEIIFSEEECRDIATRVYKLKSRWESKSFNRIMQTCGRPSYLGNALAGNNSGIANSEMMEIFSDAMERVRRAFECRYPHATIVFGGGGVAPRAGVPGFHIFRASKPFQWPVASLHVDRQYVNAGFTKSGKVPNGGTISFTVLIQEPEGGAGLHIWDVSSEPNASAEGGTYPPSRGELTLPLPLHLYFKSSRYHRHIKYVLGGLVIHDGHHYHLIAPNSPQATRDRITLQGHGVWGEEADKNTLYLYW